MCRQRRLSKRSCSRSSRLIAALLCWSAAAQTRTGNEREPFNPNVIRAQQHFSETGGQQVGGVVNGQLVMWGFQGSTGVGVLRCPDNQAMVGADVRRGSAVDYLRIYCATAIFDQRARAWFWRSANPGPAAGTPGAGAQGFRMVCPQRYMITGFRAWTRDNGRYLFDIQFECGLLRTGPSIPLDALNPNLRAHAVFRPGTQQTPNDNNFSRMTGQRQGLLPYRTWTPRDVGGAQVPLQSGGWGYDEIQPMTLCQTGGATGISFGLGRFGLTQTRVVQAISLYCPGELIDTHAARRNEF